MGSLSEKLEFFNEVILKDATSERDRVMHQLEEETRARLSSERKKFQEEADAFLKKDTALTENEKNRIISKAILESRQLLIKKREEIMDAVFSDVKALLKTFVESQEYSSFIEAQIKASCSLAGEGELTVLVSKGDMQRFSFLIDRLKENLPSGILFEETGDEIIGGCQVINKSTNIIVNNTLMERLKCEMDSFLEKRNLKLD